MSQTVPTSTYTCKTNEYEYDECKMNNNKKYKKNNTKINNIFIFFIL